MSTHSGSESRVVSRGTQTTDYLGHRIANIEKLIEKLIEGVQPSVKQSQPDLPERRFKCDAKRWLRSIKPTRESLEFCVDLLLSMFIRDEAGKLTLAMSRFEHTEYSETRWPTFMQNLILVVPGERDIKLGNKTPALIARIRVYVLSKLAISYDQTKHRVNELELDNTRWTWNSSRGSGFHLYRGRRGQGPSSFTPWSSSRHTSLEEWYEPEAIGCGYGTTSVVFAPVKEGLLKFRCINLILAHTGRWIDKTSSEFLLFDYTASIMYFLGVFAGEWPSSDERAWFTRNSPTRSTVYDSYAGPIFLTYIQVHLRFFEAVNTLNHDRTTGERNGLKCNREQGSIISESGTTYFEEKRISIFGVLSFTEFAPENRRYEAPTFYNISVLGDFESFPHRSGEFEWRAGLEGTIAFHAALYASVNIWQVTWNQLLDAIDEHLRVRIGDTLDPKKIDTWMFDETGFQRSKSYVTSLQVLRIFDECVRTVSYDFRVLGRLFIQTRQFPMLHMQPEAIRILESNWRWVETFQKQAEESILGRIAQKTEEVKSLRDGLFNATSLREANLSSREASRATSMGRYVLVFTVVTILYLPPSFISTVFALDIFKKDLAQSKWEFKVSLVAVSLFTYLIAFASIIAVDWNGFKRRGKAMLEGFLQTLAPPISDS